MKEREKAREKRMSQRVGGKLYVHLSLYTHTCWTMQSTQDSRFARSTSQPQK